jgi:hypothetical protein
MSALQIKLGPKPTGNEMLTEARRRLGLNIDDAYCDANRKRLAPMMAIQEMPKKDTGWAT